MKLKRKKIGDRNYNLVDTQTGQVIANAVKTGEDGRDNYPWEWSLMADMVFGRLGSRTGKSEESLKVCVEYIESMANQYGLFKPVGSVEPRRVGDLTDLLVLRGDNLVPYKRV